MDYFTKRERIVILAVVFIVISVVVFKMGFKELKQNKNQPLNFVNSYAVDEEEDEPNEENSTI